MTPPRLRTILVTGASSGIGRELARIAARARPKLLVLYHQLYWGGTDASLVRQIAAGYRGAVASGRDLGVY